MPTKKITTDCPYCHKPMLVEIDDEEPIDIYFKENDKDHIDHIDYAAHMMNVPCNTCENDDPNHCQYACEGMADGAEDMHDR